MFTLKSSDEKSGLEKAIADALSEMETLTPGSEDYAKVMDHVAVLYKLKETSSPKRVSADTVALIGGNLAGILIIVFHERANVITSKALSFVGKLK